MTRSRADTQKPSAFVRAAVPSSPWNVPAERRWRPLLGLLLCASSAIVFASLTVSMIGDLLPINARTGVGWINHVLADDYYSRALPTLVPGTIAYVYFHWLGARFFEHT